MKFGPEHIIKVADDSRCLPGSFRQKSLKPGLRMILARKRKGASLEPVSYAFQKNMFTAEEVNSWCREHEVKKYNLGTGDLDPVVPAVQQTPSPQTMEMPEPPKSPPPPPPEEKEEKWVWLATLRDLQDFDEETLVVKDVSPGVKSLVGDLTDGSMGIVWAIVFDNSFDERTANEWLTASSVHASVLPLDDLDDAKEIINPGPGPEDMPWNKPISKQVTIFKMADEEKHLLTGVVLQPDIEDSQGDIISEEEIAEAAHNFMNDYRKEQAAMGTMHNKVNPAIHVVESFVAPDDLTINNTQVKRGSWLITCKIRDANVWKKVKSGEFQGFSIGGKGQREPIV